MTEKCFFCDKIIIPDKILTTEGILKYFKEHNIEFSLNYVRSRSKIGNKKICFCCEKDLVDIIDVQLECDCDECKKEKDLNNFIERYGK